MAQYSSLTQYGPQSSYIKFWSYLWTEGVSIWPKLYSIPELWPRGVLCERSSLKQEEGAYEVEIPANVSPPYVLGLLFKW